jgi:enoyl-CoA hydratase
MQDVLFHTQGALGIITLNRPKALNALTPAMFQAIAAELRRWAHDDSITAVVICGEGERAFCAGGDIRYLYQSRQEQQIELADHFIIDEYRLNYQIATYPKPYISLTHGVTMGGGIGVSVYGQRRYASDNLVWAMPETSIGLFPDIGASYFLSRLGAVGMYLALTGAKVNAASLMSIDLVDAVIPHANFAKLLPALCELDLSEDPLARIDAFMTNIPKSEAQSFPERAVINACFNQDSVEAIMQTLLDEGSAFATQTMNDLKRRSPTSLKITFEAMKRGKNLDLREALAQECSMTYHCFRSHDLFEGIRAAVIDKDGQPKWQPASLSEVSSEDVAAYFESPVSLWVD